MAENVLARKARTAYRRWHRVDIHIACQLQALKDRQTLAQIRTAGRPLPSLADKPLVSVRIPTFNRSALLIERAVKSILAQTYQSFEIVVVGDHCTDDTGERLAALNDPRIRFTNLAKRGVYPTKPELRWLVAGLDAANIGIRLSRGEWLTHLDDDDEFTPDHIERLLEACYENDYEFVYGVMEMEKKDGTWERLGAWPPRCGSICHGAILYSARLQHFEYTIDSWKVNRPADWNLWNRMKRAGVRMGFVDAVVGRHYREMNNPGLYS
ncbi:MAG: glycosyltransferase family 2 protein [Candidatus Geothermincolia bacterium]